MYNCLKNWIKNVLKNKRKANVKWEKNAEKELKHC